MIRYGFFLFAMAMDSVVWAQSGVQLCQRITTQQELNECVAVVGGRRVDAAAATLCSRITTNREVVDCARAVAGVAVSEEAATVCSTITTNREVVDCARAAAGHWLDSGAVQACGRVTVNSEVVRCAQAIADKHYGPDELSLCERSATNDGIVQCLRGAGRRRHAPPIYAPQTPPAYGAAPAPPSYFDDPGPAAPTGETPMSWLTLTNQTAATPLHRLHVRGRGYMQWSANRLTGPLYPGQSTTLQLPPGNYDVCGEAPDGSSVLWNRVRIREAGGSIFLQRGREFPDAWAVRVPCRNL